MVRLWDCICGDVLLVMTGHTDYIESVAYSSCGNRIASASRDKTVRLWDSETGVCIFVLEGHTESATSVRFFPDGRQLVSGSWDETIRFWDSETGEPGVVLSLSLLGIYILAISPDSRWIASGHGDGNVRLWDMVTGSPGPVLQGHSDLVTGIAFSPNSQLIVTPSRNRRVMLWDASTGDIISTFDGHLNSVWDVAFSPDGHTIASGSLDKTVRLWEVNSSRSNIAIQDQIGGTRQVAYSPDGLSVVYFDGCSAIRQGDATTGVRGSVSFELPDPETINSKAFSANGDQIAAFYEGGSARLWDRSTGVEERVLNGFWYVVKTLAYSTCGRWIATCGMDKIVRLWDLHDTEQQCVLVEWEGGDGSRISDLKFSPTGHQLAICSIYGRVWLFNPQTRGLLTSKNLMEERILALDYSPNGQQLVLGTQTSIALWDLQSEEPHLELK
ncbi:U3 snoRNP protein, partial [Linnemannia elongata]